MSSEGSGRRRSTSRGRPPSAKKSPARKRSSSRSSTRASSLASDSDIHQQEITREPRRRVGSDSVSDTPAKSTRSSKKQRSKGASFSFNSETATSVAAAAFLLYFAQTVVYSVFDDEVREDVIDFLSLILSKSVAADILSTLGDFYLHVFLPLPIYYFSNLILIGDPKKADDSAKSLARLVQFSVSVSYLLYAFITDGGNGDYFESEISRAFIFLSLVSSINEFLLYGSTYNTAKQGHFASVVLVNAFFVWNHPEFGGEYFEEFLLSHALCLATSEVSLIVKNGFQFFENRKPSFLVHMMPYALGLFFIALILFGEFASPSPLPAYAYAVIYTGFHARDNKAFAEETH